MNQDPLAQLRDIHLPDSLSMWPMAMGWWILLALIILLLALIGWGIRRHLANKKRQAMIQRELNKLLSDYKIQGDFQHYLQSLSELLKRAAISLRGDNHVAAYAGNTWQQYVYQYARQDQKYLCNYFGDELYQRKGSGDVPALQQFAKDWITAKEKTEVSDA
ncbi:MAG: hypothetical protein ACJAQS_001583 [Porticoccus sp.]|jgi:hypothetical protein